MNIAPDQKLLPEKITKPFQLLAAWLVGLILVNGSLLSAATLLKEPSWVAPMLSIAAILNVPVFLVAIFLLQTKFRPQMQEDSFYSKYLENQNTKSPQISTSEELGQIRFQVSNSQKQTLEIIKGVQDQIGSLKNEIVLISKGVGQSTESEKRISHLENLLRQSTKDIEVAERKMDWSVLRVLLNDLLPKYVEILAALKSNGITVSKTFGSRVTNEPETPKTFVLSVGLSVPIAEFKQMITLLRPFGLEAITLNKDETDLRSIYIGSYLYRKLQATPLDEKVVAAISNAKSTEDLKSAIITFSRLDFAS